jgi:putative acetyltransferase
MPASAHTDDLRLRPIAPADDAAVAAIIRTVMPEFGACGSGFAINDPEVDRMCATYAQPRSAYWVVERGGRVVGGGGIAPLRGGDPETCELQKMYFLPELRGLGLGRELLALCLARAREHGFRRCYLETLKGMAAAQRLYAAAGFRKIEAPLGRTGHFSCDTFYLLDL